MSAFHDLRSSTVSNYSIIFPFEANFDPNRKQEWMVEHRHQAFYFIGIYLLVIFGGKAYMHGRPKMELQSIIAVWNITLALYSIIGLCRTFPALLYDLTKFGFAHSVCDPTFIAQDKVTAFWCWIFALSKLPEFADSVFIVLRKHQLIFLHWYHHITVLLFAWYCYSEHVSATRWFVVMNFFAHSMMYTYYALRVMRISLPTSFSIGITSVQIIQMIIGFYVSYFSYVSQVKGEYCQFPKYLTFCGMFLYMTFLVLFSWFFYRTYLNAKMKDKKLL